MSRAGLINSLITIFTDLTGKTSTVKATEIGGTIYDETIGDYPIGSFYVQFPDANDNDDAVAFPPAYAPAALFGGTWTAQWDTVPTFFCTQGDFLALTELQADDRTNGLQTAQMQAHAHHLIYNDSANDPITTTNVLSTYYNPAKTGTNWTHATHASTSAAYDIGYGLSHGYATRPQNRLIKVWKRTA